MEVPQWSQGVGQRSGRYSGEAKFPEAGDLLQIIGLITPMMPSGRKQNNVSGICWKIWETVCTLH